jgi:hypothetical protein
LKPTIGEVEDFVGCLSVLNRVRVALLLFLSCLYNLFINKIFYLEKERKMSLS